MHLPAFEPQIDSLQYLRASEILGEVANFEQWLGAAIVDFDAIKRGVLAGAPRRYAWTAAFGLVVTLVWLYLEMLRIFAILSGRR